MKKSDLVDAVAEGTGVSKKDVEATLNETFDVIAKQVSSGDEVNIQGWVKFEQVERKARTGHNPQTGEKMEIPASKAVKVTALAKLKAAGKG